MTFAQAYRLYIFARESGNIAQTKALAFAACGIYSKEVDNELTEASKELTDTITDTIKTLQSEIKAVSLRIIVSHINIHADKKEAAMAVKMALGEEVIQELTPEWVRSEFLGNWNKKQQHGNDNNA